METYAKLETLVAALPVRPRMILERRYGLDGGEVAGLDAIGALIGKTSERARQLEMAALGRLRGMLADEVEAVR